MPALSWLCVLVVVSWTLPVRIASLQFGGQFPAFNPKTNFNKNPAVNGNGAFNVGGNTMTKAKYNHTSAFNHSSEAAPPQEPGSPASPETNGSFVNAGTPFVSPTVPTANGSSVDQNTPFVNTSSDQPSRPSTSTPSGGSVCDVTKFGSGGSGDIGPAIQAAFSSCGKSGGTLYIPPGSYSLKTRVVLSGFRGLTIQWDGDITLALGLGSDAWFQINSASDFVLKGKGSFNGQGTSYRASNGVTEKNPRLMRCYDCSNFEISGVTLHDAPSYHLVVRGRNGYLHDFAITSPTNPRVGTTDGVDLTCDTCLVERVDVDNGDDSVVMKSPVHNVIVRNCVFKHGNGAAIGSNGNGGNWDISNVTFSNIEMQDVIGAAYIKSYNRGSGSIRDLTWMNIKVVNAAYTVAVDQQWCGHNGCGGGNDPMAFYNIRYSGWSGTSDSSSRPVVLLRCNKESPCYGITFENFSVTKPSGGTTTKITNACGSGLSDLPPCPSDWRQSLNSLLSAAHGSSNSKSKSSRKTRIERQP